MTMSEFQHEARTRLQMKRKPIFPTILHRELAEVVRDYFMAVQGVDTVLVVNSCARGQAVPESDLDFAILISPGISTSDAKNAEHHWQTYLETQTTFVRYKQSHQFAHLHLDIIDGNYSPGRLEPGEPIDYFEVEIGNQILYSAPFDDAGEYFMELQNRWLPYYDEKLRLQRLLLSRSACEYDLDHIPFFMKRGLCFQAFDILCKAFQEYLQTLFIASKTYPIAYNKWIKEQIVLWLDKPALYPKLPSILSVSDIQSNEVNEKAHMLRELLNNIATE